LTDYGEEFNAIKILKEIKKDCVPIYYKSKVALNLAFKFKFPTSNTLIKFVDNTLHINKE